MQLEKRSDTACCNVRPSIAAQVLQFTHGVLVDLADVPGRANAALGLLLAAATAASQETCAELIAYEFFEQVRVLVASTLHCIRHPNS